MGLLKLADKYSVDRLEAACCKALTFTATPSYKSIKNILDTGSDRTEPADKVAVTDSHTSSEKKQPRTYTGCGLLQEVRNHDYTEHYR